jgi:hypothetical protein
MRSVLVILVLHANHHNVKKEEGNVKMRIVNASLLATSDIAEGEKRVARHTPTISNILTKSTQMRSVLVILAFMRTIMM